MKYYFAMIELDDERIKETQASQILHAMEELKSACNPNGKVTYYHVTDEKQYKRAERELKCSMS